MPIIVVLVAILLIVIGIRGTQNQAFCLVKQDASGQFLYWFSAVFVIGSVGYIKKLEPISNGLLVLLVLALFLTTKGGIFSQVSKTLSSNIVSQPLSNDLLLGSAPTFPALPTLPTLGLR